MFKNINKKEEHESSAYIVTEGDFDNEDREVIEKKHSFIMNLKAPTASSVKGSMAISNYDDD